MSAETHGHRRAHRDKRALTLCEKRETRNREGLKRAGEKGLEAVIALRASEKYPLGAVDRAQPPKEVKPRRATECTLGRDPTIQTRTVAVRSSPRRPSRIRASRIRCTPGPRRGAGAVLDQTHSVSPNAQLTPSRAVDILHRARKRRCSSRCRDRAGPTVPADQEVPTSIGGQSARVWRQAHSVAAIGLWSG